MKTLAPASQPPATKKAAAPLHAGAPGIVMLPPVPDAFGFAGAFAGVHENHLLAGGGANFPDGVMPWNGGRKVWHDRLFSLDLSRTGATWQDAGRLPVRNGYGVSLSVEEGILIIGGSNETSHLREVHLMTLNGGCKAGFHPLPPLPKPLAQMTGAAVGRRIHLCGGITKPDATVALTDHWVLDLDALPQGWQAARPLPAAGRILATSAAVDHDFMIAAGCSLAADPHGAINRTYLLDAWKFSDGAWQQLADLPRAAVAAATPAPATHTSVFIVSGDDGTQTGLSSPGDHRGFSSQILRYDAAADCWSSCGDLHIPPAVTLPTAPWGNGTIFFNGEIKPGVRTPQVFLFTPAA